MGGWLRGSAIVALAACGRSEPADSAAPPQRRAYGYDPSTLETVSPSREFTDDALLSNVAVGDVDGDGFDDLAWIQGDAREVQLARGPALLPAPLSLGGVTDLVLVDANGDGRDDVIARTEGAWHCAYGGADPLAFTLRFAEGDDPYAYARGGDGLGDLDGDGFEDLTTGDAVWFGGADGFTRGAFEVMGPDTLFGAGDVDGDGYDDLVVWREDGGYAGYYGDLDLVRGEPSRTAFAPTWTWSAPLPSAEDVVGGELGGLPGPELAIVASEQGYGGSSVTVLHELGGASPVVAASQTFDGELSQPPAVVPLTLATGEPALAVSVDAAVEVWRLEPGDLPLVGAWRADPHDHALEVTAGDFDGDGVSDPAAIVWRWEADDLHLLVWLGGPNPFLPAEGPADSGPTPGTDDDEDTVPVAREEGCGCAHAVPAPGWLVIALVAARVVRQRRVPASALRA